MKKRNGWPARQDSRITSQYVPDTGDIVIGVARGFTGAGEVLYKLTPEVLAGAIEDRRELAVIVNNLGLLVLAQLSGFNLAESLDDLPRALAKWGHMEKEFTEAQREKQMAEALAIAQKTVHGMHGHSCDPDNGIECSGCVCECTGTPSQMICAKWCTLCKESDEGHDTAGNRGADSGDGFRGEDSGGSGPGIQGAPASDALAPDELSA
jgi:hypothetical protein